MTPFSDPTPRRSGPSSKGPAGSNRPSALELLWRNGFFYMSAVMGALALVDFDAGRLAHGLGDAGVACLMLSLTTQFGFVRAVIQANDRQSPEQARQALLDEATRLRAAYPWADRLNRVGWVLLLMSLALRVTGAA